LGVVPRGGIEPPTRGFSIIRDLIYPIISIGCNGKIQMCYEMCLGNDTEVSFFYRYLGEWLQACLMVRYKKASRARKIGQ